MLLKGAGFSETGQSPAEALAANATATRLSYRLNTARDTHQAVRLDLLAEISL